MKMALAVLALCACTQGALAAGPDCRAIDSTTGKLACYDAAYPRPKMEKPAALKTTHRAPPTRIRSSRRTPERAAS